MMAESVQPTGRAVRRLEPLAIEIPGEPEPSNSYDAFCDRHFSAENMETKTKIYISLLLILPSLIYFLVVINFPNPKRVHVEPFETPTVLNITTFSEETLSTEEYAQAFELAVKNDQLVLPTGVSSETIRRYVASTARRDSNDESTVYLLRHS